MSFEEILIKLGIKSDRSKNITKHVFLSTFYKGGSIISTFLLVPLTIDYLDAENYGIWLTLSSFIAWFSFFDVGLGNGLRNKFAEARTLGDYESAKGYVSTAYYTLGSMSIVLFIMSLLTNTVVDWSAVFNTSFSLREELNLLMPLVFGCFSLRLLLSLVTSIFLADQNHSITGKVNFFIALISLIVIWVLTQTSNSSLLIFGLVISFVPVLILVILNIYAFKGSFKKYLPKYSYWRKNYLKDIFGQGISFFIIQISMIILVSTDNLIITQILGPEEVVPYNISYKYMGISSMILGIVLAPYWSSFTEAYISKETQWIKKSMNSLKKIVVLAIILTLFLLLISNFAYTIWVGDKVKIPFVLSFCMAIYFITTICYAPFVMFINGVGKIKLQMYLLAFGAIVNIPISILLLKFTKLGVEAVIIATLFCVLPCLFLYPLQYQKLVNEKAKGIWDK